MSWLEFEILTARFALPVITDAMFIAAARASADKVSQDMRDKGMLFPSQSAILQIEVTTTVRIAELIFDQGEATVERPADVRAWIKEMLYSPEFVEFAAA